MRRSLLFLLLVVLWIPALGACGRAPEPGDLDRADLEVRMYQVDALDCEGCPERLEARVTQLPAVVDAEAVGAEGSLTVWINPYKGVTDETIFSAIAEAGFEPGKRIR